MPHVRFVFRFAKEPIVNDLTHLRVAVLATDGFEDSELIEPIEVLTSAGAQISIVSVNSGHIQGLQQMTKTVRVPVDWTLDEINVEKIDAIHLPGGALNADALRVVPKVQALLQTMQETGKPIAAICHAPWLLISAGLVRGRSLTSYHTIRDDIRNAGGNWINQDVVVDGNWVTSRQPSDLSAFNRAMVELFARTAAMAPH
jgi:protease I